MATTTIQIIQRDHATLSAVLGSLLLLLDHGPGDAPERFFDVMRAMLFYVDEFPERRHHPKESDLLFPKLARARPDLMPVILALEQDHMDGEGRVRELQHLLLAWELLGSRAAAGSPPPPGTTQPSTANTCGPRRRSCCPPPRPR